MSDPVAAMTEFLKGVLAQECWITLTSWTEPVRGDAATRPAYGLGAQRNAPKHYKRRTIVARCARGGAKHSGKAAR